MLSLLKLKLLVYSNQTVDAYKTISLVGVSKITSTPESNYNELLLQIDTIINKTVTVDSTLEIDKENNLNLWLKAKSK